MSRRSPSRPPSLRETQSGRTFCLWTPAQQKHLNTIRSPAVINASDGAVIGSLVVGLHATSGSSKTSGVEAKAQYQRPESRAAAGLQLCRCSYQSGFVREQRQIFTRVNEPLLLLVTQGGASCTSFGATLMRSRVWAGGAWRHYSCWSPEFLDCF